MRSIENYHILTLWLATFLLIVTYSSGVEGKSAADKKNAGIANDGDLNVPPSNEDDVYTDDDESISQEQGHPLSTLHPYFDKNITTIYIKEMGRKLTLHCPVKNYDDKQQISWFKEENNIALGKNSFSDVYEVDDAKFRLIIKNYNDTARERNFYCEILPQHLRFQILVKVGEGNNGISPPPDQILASGIPGSSSAHSIWTVERVFKIRLVCLLITTLSGIQLLQVA